MYVFDVLERLKRDGSEFSMLYRYSEHGSDQPVKEPPIGVFLRDIFSITITKESQECIWEVPKLVNEELYPEWLDRMIAYYLHVENMEYKEYQVKRAITSEAFNIYTCSDVVTFYSEEDSTMEQWSLSPNNELKVSIFEKEGTGLRNTHLGESKLWEYMNVPGDLYRNPSNANMDAFLPTPERAYWGKDVYYDPTNAEHILLNMGGEWIWSVADMVFLKLPNPYKEELTLIKQLYNL